MLGRPIFTQNETVTFLFDDMIKTGVIEIIDAYGCFEISDEVCYDVLVAEDNCLYKHLRESDLMIFTATKLIEDNGSITLSLNEFDLIENGENEDAARLNLGKSILDYAVIYSTEYDLYSTAPNRTGHLPYVKKALLVNDAEIIGKNIICTQE